MGPKGAGERLEVKAERAESCDISVVLCHDVGHDAQAVGERLEDGFALVKQSGSTLLVFFFFPFPFQVIILGGVEGERGKSGADGGDACAEVDGMGVVVVEREPIGGVEGGCGEDE